MRSGDNFKNLRLHFYRLMATKLGRVLTLGRSFSTQMLKSPNSCLALFTTRHILQFTTFDSISFQTAIRLYYNISYRKFSLNCKRFKTIKEMKKKNYYNVFLKNVFFILHFYNIPILQGYCWWVLVAS